MDWLHPEKVTHHVMKTITINVSEPVYREFQLYAKAHDRTASELVRQAMEEYRRAHLQPGPSLRDVQPVSVGRVLRPLVQGDDLLRDMLIAFSMWPNLMKGEISRFSVDKLIDMLTRAGMQVEIYVRPHAA